MFNNLYGKRKTKVLKYGNLCTIVHAAARSRKLKISAKRLLRTRSTFSKSGISSGVTRRGEGVERGGPPRVTPSGVWHPT